MVGSGLAFRVETFCFGSWREVGELDRSLVFTPIELHHSDFIVINGCCVEIFL